MIIALERGFLGTFVDQVNQAKQAGKDFLLPVRIPPKGLGTGSKCYVSVDGRVCGYVNYVDVVALDKPRVNGGKKLPPGWYIVLRGPFEEMDVPSPLGNRALGNTQLGHHSYRYCGDLDQ